MKLIIEISESRRSEKEKKLYGKVSIHNCLATRGHSSGPSQMQDATEDLRSWDNSFSQALEVARLTELSRKIDKLVEEYYDSEADKFSIFKKTE